MQLYPIVEAFTYLKERLDPDEDVFDAAAKFRRMAWSPGEPIQDFFTRYLEEAIKAGLSSKATCVFMVSQPPPEVQLKLKEWAKPKKMTCLKTPHCSLEPSGVLRKALADKSIGPQISGVG